MCLVALRRYGARVRLHAKLPRTRFFRSPKLSERLKLDLGGVSSGSLTSCSWRLPFQTVEKVDLVVGMASVVGGLTGANSVVYGVAGVAIAPTQMPCLVQTSRCSPPAPRRPVPATSQVF